MTVEEKIRMTAERIRGWNRTKQTMNASDYYQY